MRKVLAVCLFFVSFTIFAQKQEITRLHWEVRDYDRLWQYEYEEGDERRQYTWKEIQIHILNSMFIEPYESSFPPFEGPKSIIRGIERLIFTEEKSVIITNYLFSEKYGRWYYFTKFHYPGNKGFASMANDICQYLKLRFPEKKFTWVDNTDFDTEETYFLGNMGRKDENGVPYYSFQVEFIMYAE